MMISVFMVLYLVFSWYLFIYDYYTLSENWFCIMTLYQSLDQIKTPKSYKNIRYLRNKKLLDISTWILFYPIYCFKMYENILIN